MSKARSLLIGLTESASQTNTARTRDEMVKWRESCFLFISKKQLLPLPHTGFESHSFARAPFLSPSHHQGGAW
jgi:hypothetical protein